MPTWLILLILAGAIYLLWVQHGQRRKQAIADLLADLEPLRQSIPPAQGETLLPDSDSQFDRLDAGATPDVVPAHNLLLIEYCDAAGARSRRRITVRSCAWVSERDAYLQSYCHERRAMRSFLLSRVTSVVDMQTGEMASSPVDYFRTMAPQSLYGLEGGLLVEMDAEVMILLYLARADDRMVKAERKVIVDFLVNSAHDKGASAERLDGRLKSMRAESADFRDALRAMSKRSRQERLALFQAAEALVGADRKLADSETVMLKKLRKALAV